MFLLCKVTVEELAVVQAEHGKVQVVEAVVLAQTAIMLPVAPQEVMVELD
jgi:hypothetical protein